MLLSVQVWSSSEGWGKSASYCSCPPSHSLNLFQVWFPSLSFPGCPVPPGCAPVATADSSRASLHAWAALLMPGEDRQTWGGSQHDIMTCFGSPGVVEPREPCRDASILKKWCSHVCDCSAGLDSSECTADGLHLYLQGVSRVYSWW